MSNISKKSLELLRSATLKILEYRQPAYSLRPEVLEIIGVLKNVSKFQINQDRDIAKDETLTKNGLALSPTMAAMCADDYVRTIVFIRGLHDAIQDIRKCESDRPIRILYVGSGPYATLAIPLMSVFSIEEVKFEILDLHRESIESVRCLVEGLEFSEYVSNYEVIDAEYKQINPKEPPDIIIMEIMNTCLEKEPQVAITRHLLEQAPSAIMIPQSITIDANLINTAKEFAVNTSGKKKAVSQRERIFLGKVFELSRETVNSWKNEPSDKLPASSIKITSPLGNDFQPMLFTRIQVYGNHHLSEYQSGLTCPKVFPFRDSIKRGETLKFYYRLGKHPGLLCESFS
ncbi:MAG: hypothetical protein AAGA80_26980 [Cyanobacteria bacterium P01_F01_bin.143]